MNNISEKIQQLISEEKGSWLEDVQFRADNKKWLRRSQSVALTILRTLREKGLSQKALAECMGVSAQLVNRWVKGRENFTFETIAKLEEALEIELMTV
jgi:ribosome-binding protein aMBF1 (putative translation factor)